MPTIPRALLGKPAISGESRRQQALPGTNAGIDKSYQSAILQQDRGLDLGELGDAIYAAGGALAEAEAKRKAYELKMQQMRDDTTLQTVLMQTTTQANQAYEQLRVRGIEDPAKARGELNGAYAQINGANEAIMAKLGPKAQRDYTAAVAKLYIEHNSNLVKYAVEKTHERANEAQHAALSASLDFAATSESDEQATAVFERITDDIVKSGIDGRRTPDQAKQLALWYRDEYIVSRYGKKAKDNFAQADMWMRSLNLPPELEAKLRARAYKTAKASNDHREMNQKIMDAEEKRASDEAYKKLQASLSEAHDQGDLVSVQQQRDFIQDNATNFEPGTLKSLLALTDKYLEGDSSDSFTTTAGLKALQFVESVNNSMAEKHEYVAANKGSLNKYEMRELHKMMGEQERGEKSDVRRIRGDIRKAARAKLLGIAQAAGDGKYFMKGVMGEKANAKFDAMMTQLENDLRAMENDALYANGADGNNVTAYRQGQFQIIDNLVSSYSGMMQKEGSQVPRPVGGSGAHFLNMATQRGPQGNLIMDEYTRVQGFQRYKAYRLSLDPSYDPLQDEALQEAQEKIRNYMTQQVQTARDINAIYGTQPQAQLPSEMTGTLPPEQQLPPAGEAPEAAKAQVIPADPLAAQLQQGGVLPQPTPPPQPIPQGGPLQPEGEVSAEEIEAALQQALPLVEPAPPAEPEAAPEQPPSEPGVMTQAGRQHLEAFEGRRAEVYDDATGKTIDDPKQAKGYPTIGIGHRLTDAEIASGKVTINGEEVDYKDGLSDEQIDALLDQDMAWARDVVDKVVKVPLTPNEYDALVSFAFNIGASAFRKAGAIKALNSGDKKEFLRRHAQWNKSKGKKMEGLVNRRAGEAKLFASVE